MSKICPNCHQQIADDAKFCNNCGAQQPLAGSPPSGYTQNPNQSYTNQGYTNPGYTRNQGQNTNQSQGQAQGAYGGNVPPGEAFSTTDVEKNKVISALAYFIFFLPLIAAPDSRFGRFHANQGLLLLIVSVVGHIILGMIPFIGSRLSPLFSLACFVLAIIGLSNTLSGKARELPVIGQYRLIH